MRSMMLVMAMAMAVAYGVSSYVDSRLPIIAVSARDASLVYGGSCDMYMSISQDCGTADCSILGVGPCPSPILLSDGSEESMKNVETALVTCSRCGSDCGTVWGTNANQCN
jgi:hypothetical protein